MRKYFVFVESPRKTEVFQKSLQEYFNKKNNIVVIATKGHIYSSVIKELHSANDHIEWEMKPWAKTMLGYLAQHKIESEDCIVLATDPDREGEAISKHVESLLMSEFKIPKQNFVRIRCNSLTVENIKQEFEESLKNETKVCDNMYNSYLTRVFIDMCVGIRGSQLLHTKAVGCPSMGRVQSCAILKLYDKDNEIRRFKREEYYSLSIDGAKILKNGEDINKLGLPSEDLEKIRSEIESKQFTYKTTKTSSREKHNIEPLDTADLYSLCQSRAGLSLYETRNVCQKLYEDGIITYPRTDSKVINPQFQEQIKEFIEKKYGAEDVRKYVQKFKHSKNAQEAHEAIRPTKLSNIKEVTENMNRKECAVYSYVLFNSVAPFMRAQKWIKKEHIYECDEYTVIVEEESIEVLGYLKLAIDIGIEDEKELKRASEEEQPAFAQFKPQLKKHETQCESRYNEGSLTRELKKEGIGRPSTYEYIAHTIKEKQYSVYHKNNYFITGKGIFLAKFVKEYAPELICYKFTNEMENILDKIAKGETDPEECRIKFLNQINTAFSKVTQKDKREIVEEICNKMLEDYGKKCPKCDQDLIMRFIKLSPCVICSNCVTINEINKHGYVEESCVPKYYVYNPNSKIKRIVKPRTTSKKKP